MQALMKRAIEQKAKSASLFEALAQLHENPLDSKRIAAVKELISNGADVRVRNENKLTLFHLLQNMPCRIELLKFILKTKPKLDGITLTEFKNNIFISDDSLPGIDELENLSFKHTDLTGFSFATIKKITTVDFSEAILCDVTFHPEVVFVNCSFKNAVVDENGPSVEKMDMATIATLPKAWKQSAIQTDATLQGARSFSLFSVITSVTQVSPSTGTGLTLASRN